MAQLMQIEDGVLVQQDAGAVVAEPGAVTKPALADQTDQAWCLTVLTNYVITWTTDYYSLAVRQLRAVGRDVPDELLAHISPAHSENVNFFGVINVDVEAELAKLDTSGWRPLRPAQTARAGADALQALRRAPMKGDGAVDLRSGRRRARATPRAQAWSG
ncbi:Tn3 family transposase [Nonomuraea sp. JJY05]